MRPSPNAILGILYEDGPGGYRAVELDVPGKREPERFATGDPVADWATASQRAKALVESGEAPTCFTRSSVTHFVFDVPGYRFNLDDNIEIDPADWTDGVLTPAIYEDIE